MWEELARLAERERLTILLTTHYLEEADRLAERVAIVSRGRIVVEGTPDALKRELRGDAVTFELANGGGRRSARASCRALADVHEVIVDGPAPARARRSRRAGRAGHPRRARQRRRRSRGGDRLATLPRRRLPPLHGPRLPLGRPGGHMTRDRDRRCTCSCG